MNPPELDAATRRALEANVRRFYLYKFLYHFYLWLPIWVLYLQQERGLSLTQVTALEAPFWLVNLVSEVPTGAVADRWGRKSSLLLGCAVYTVAILVFGLATSFWLLLISYVAWGVAITLGSGADSAFLYDSLVALGRAGEFRKVLGRAQAWMTVAVLVSALLGAPLAAATRLSVPILAGAGVTVLAGLVVLTFREPPYHESAPRLPYFAVLREAARYTLRHAPLRAMMAVYAVMWGAGMAGILFVQPFLAHHGVPVARFGLLEVPGRLLAVGGALVAHRLALRLGERPLFAGLTAAFTTALLVLAGVPSMLAFAMFWILTCCSSMVNPLSSDYINRHSPQHLRATLASVAQMAASIVLAIAAPLLGMIADRRSLETMFLVAGVGVGVFGTGALLAWFAVTRQEHASTAAGEVRTAGVE